AADIDAWYAAREGKALVNYGVTVGHIPVRMRQFGDTGRFLPANTAVDRRATGEEITEMARAVERGLQRGAVGVGFGMAYTPGAGAVEYLELFRVAARFGVAAYAHVASGVEGLMNAVGYAASTGAALHVVHLNSSGGRRNTPEFLRVIEDVRKRGMDVTTECYPYTAGQTAIDSAIFADGWQGRLGVGYEDLLWPATGERLNAESFARYRKQGGSVILFTNTEEMVERAVVSPLTMIASDGILRNGVGHPRSTGTYARVLGKYVREKKALGLMEAVRKMALLPAQRLEKRVAGMRNKGRIRVGADADVVVFAPGRVRDLSDYGKPGVLSEGFRYVMVGGVLVVEGGSLQEARMAGRAVRGEVQ
ncbi:MAG: amidohydrolase family protein, partial [Bryobacterales bacterium]|nr:amidohydrolase family protein [Bryobacterales bacterium]